MNKDRYLIRILDDDEEFLDAIEFLLKTEGWRTAGFSSPIKFFNSDTIIPASLYEVLSIDFLFTTVSHKARRALYSIL